ncbi:MAG: RNase P subunit p30 family protein [Haloferacaceae archaeon]
MTDPAPYEAVHARPDGESTVARHARTAARQGYGGLVVRTRGATVPDGVEERYGVDLVSAIEVTADDPEAASGAVGEARPDHTLLLVRGGTARMNRFAVEQARVDVLAAPTGAGDGADRFNHVLARAAAENGVRVEFDLAPVLRAEGGTRVRAVSDLRLLADLVEQYDAPHVVSARATGHPGLRAPRELAAVGEAVGLDAGFVRDGLAEWGRLARRNRERASDDFVMPGVWKGRADERVGPADDPGDPADGGDDDRDGGAP